MIALNNKIMDEIGVERIINETVRWDSKQWYVSPGKLAKVMVLSTIDSVRTPLYKIQRKFHDLDAEALTGLVIDESYLNDDALGRALDRIAEHAPDQVFQQIALNALMQYQVEFSRIHSDTTSISFYGMYEDDEIEESAKDGKLQIVRGYNKDHRHECKQLVYGQMTTEHGIPLAAKVMDGNTSDVEYNRLAIEIAANLFDHLGSGGEYIADSKLMTAENIKLMRDRSVPIRFISRAPANFGNKLEERVLARAYANESDWLDIGTIDEGEKKNACHYWIQGWLETVHGHLLRIVAVKSSAGIGRVVDKVEKIRKSLVEAISDVEKKIFACKLDAEKEYMRFQKTQKSSLYHYEPIYTEEKIAQRGRGRPVKNAAEPPAKSEWHLTIHIAGINAEAYESFRRMEESFVLVSSESDTSSEDILRLYKGQIVVENEFRYLKEPCIIPAVFLKKPDRINALLMLMSIALLVRALVQYRMRKGVKAYRGLLPKVGRNGGKLQENPTYNFLRDEMIGVEFRRVSNDTCDLVAPSDKIFEQAKILMGFIGYELEQLLN